MARVASCPQCSHELYVPGESDGESWVKCPDCSASFQVKQAALRELPMALLVESPEQRTADLFAQDAEQPTLLAQDDVETAVAAHPAVVGELASTEVEDGKVDRLIAAPNASWAETPTGPSDAIGILGPAPKTVDHGIVAEQADTPALDELVPAAKKGDDLEAAAQRIDEWFRSAKTVPDTPPMGDEDEMPSVEDIPSNLSTAGPIRTNPTIDARDADDLPAMADFDLDEPLDRTMSTVVPGDVPAWDDSERMEGLLGEPRRDEDEFLAEFADADDEEERRPGVAHGEESLDTEPPANRDEQPSINLFSESGTSDDESTSRRGRRRERSFARSLILIAVAGLLGLGCGYYALLWLRGPGIDFLNVAQYLPKAILPAAFDAPKPMVRNAPPVTAVEPMAAVEPTTDEATEPQELPSAANESAEPMAEVAAATETAPVDATDPSATVQTGFTDGEPATDVVAPASAVGDRYSTATNETDAAPNTSTATGVTTEKPATKDLTVDDLAPTETPLTPTDETTVPAPNLPATSEPAASEIAGAEPAANEPAPLGLTTADPLFDSASTSSLTESVEIKIANAPAFTADDLQTSAAAAAKAQPQLLTGNFGDSKAVAQAKGRSYAILADLAQKAVFTEVSQQTAPIVEQADELFRNILADAHTRAEVAQILPRWIHSPNRKHGGVFFGGKVLNHAAAGSVVECTVELDGGQQLTVLAPANAANQLDAAKPMAIVGWIVDVPKTQISGYTGSVKSPAIWTKKLIPLD